MQPRLFTSLATASGMDHVQPFSQQAWRARHCAPDPGTLCAALSAFWLAQTLSSAAPLAQLAAPGVTLPQRLAGLQALSFYPAFPEHFRPGAAELRLLAQKYGTHDWQAIRVCVAKAHQGDFVLYDLACLFDYDDASITRCAALPATLPAAPGGAAVMAVLRYLHHGRPGGHRFAYCAERGGRHRFFDQNAGAVSGPCGAAFEQWSAGFLRHAPYRKLAPAPGEAVLTLYTLFNVAPHGEPQHGRTHGERIAQPS